jgi:hypothetical protein
LGFFWCKLHPNSFAASNKLDGVQPPVMIAVDRIEFRPQVVEVHQVLQQLQKLPPLNEAIHTNICGFVCAHESGLVVEVRILQRTAQHTVDNCFIDLGKRQATVSVHI